jgi:hypothetical protein
MIKNMTRKGLAIGAGVSLVVTGLIAPAAYAVEPVQLNETVGTGYNVLNDGNFELTALITNAAKSGGSETVKFRIVDADGGLDEAGIDLGDGDATATPDGALDNSGGGTDGNDILASFTDGVAVVDTTGSDAGTAYKIMLQPDSSMTDPFSVTVQAWVDFDGDNVIDSNEFASVVRTVTFYPLDDVTFTVNLSTPTLGASNINSTVTTSPALNVAALEDDLKVGYATYVASTNAYTIVSGGGTVSSGVFSDGVTVTADNDYKLAIGGGGLAAATYAAQAVYGGAEVGARVFFTVGASDATTISAVSIVKSANTGTSADPLDIRTNTSATFKVTVTDGTDPVAGETVVFSFTETHSDTDAVINVGNHSIKNGDTATAAKTVSATTDADGVATVTASFSGFSAVDDFMTVTAKVAAVAATGAIAPDMVDTAYGAIYSHNTLGGSAVLKVTAGSTYPLTYSVLDNFGALLTSNDFRVVLSDGDSVLKTATLGSGIVSFSVTDQTTVSEVWTAAVQKYDATTANWGSSLSGSVSITPVVGASNAAAAVSLAGSATTALALNLSDLTNSDTRLGQTAPTLTNGTVATLSGTVTDAAGATTYSSVTLSAPGVMFAAGDVTSLGSITVQTSAAGAFGGVEIYSNTAGKVTITATAGSSTKTLEVTFDDAADDAGANVAVAVTNAVAGSTMKVVITVTDEYGNPVETTGGSANIVVAYDGPGFVVGGDTPTQTLADGTATFFVFLGNNDVIAGTVTATYRPTGSTSTDDITTVANIGAAAAGEARAWTRFLSATNELKIYARDVVNAGKITFVVNGNEIAWIRATSAADPKLNVASDGMVRSVFVRDMLQGRNVIEIFEDGVRIERRIFTND